MEMIERIAALEAQMRQVQRDVSDIHRLTTAVEVLANNVGQMSDKVDRIGDRLDSVEAEPGKRLVSLKATVITAICSAGATAIASAVIALIIR